MVDDPGLARTDACNRPVRVLFVAEAVTLAHVARPAVLMQSLDPDRFETLLACDPRFNSLLPEALTSRLRPIHSIDSARFIRALANGAPVYDRSTLRDYVDEDRRVIEEFRPDVIVGDFRLSLSVSAELAGIPWINLTNAYWSPYHRVPIPMPELPASRWLGVKIASLFFRCMHPFLMPLHTIPLNRVRREFGLASLGTDLRKVYTNADLTLYADIPELMATDPLPSNHRFVGPILWSPGIAFPDWWERVPANRPVIYLTLGSSGRSDLAIQALAGLADLPVTVLCATLGKLNGPFPANVFEAPYLPGEAASARANLVICNGGSPTTQQALQAGVPVLGIAGNMDQHLNMQAIEKAGAGTLLRSEHATATQIRRAAENLLGNASAAAAARSLQTAMGRYNACQRFQESLLGLLSTRSSTAEEQPAH